MAIGSLTLNGNSVLLPPEVSGPILQEAQDVSAVMQLARMVPLSEGGGAIPVIAGDIEADWTDEGAAKHVASPDLDVVNVVAKKVSCILPFSEEAGRNLPFILNELQTQGASALARAFDLAAIEGKKTVAPATAGPFDKFIAQTTKEVVLGTATQAKGGFFGDIFAADKLVSNTAGKSFSANGVILDVAQRPNLRGNFDSNGRPVDVGLPFPTVFGKITKYVATSSGYVGDWGQAVYGVARNVTVRLSNQATLKVGNDVLPLWQHNMVGLLLEANFGFACADKDAFARLKTPAAPTT